MTYSLIKLVKFLLTTITRRQYIFLLFILLQSRLELAFVNSPNMNTLQVDSEFIYLSSKNKSLPSGITVQSVYTQCMDMVRNHNSKNSTPIVIDDPEVIIVVDSKADDYDSRCAIRATWSQYSPNGTLQALSYKVYFQLGYTDEQIFDQNQHENQLYKDIIIHKHIPELYPNLGWKLNATLDILNSQKNKSLKYIVKTDDDVFVRIKAYLLHLKEMIHVDVDYEGKVLIGSPFIQNKRDKNYEPPSAALNNIYPPYCTGRGYFVKATKLDCLVTQTKTRVNLLNSDANIGYLLQFCNITLKHHQDYSSISMLGNYWQNKMFMLMNKIPFYFMHGVRQSEHIVFHQELKRFNFF